jgi:hypothetical protein
LESIEDHKTNAVVIAYQPKINELSLFLNPIALAIFSNLFIQIKIEEEKRQLESKDSPLKQ